MEARAGKPDYPLLATCFPGRSGSKVYSHYRYMMSGKDIDPLDDSSTPKYHFNFDPHIRRYFLQKSESILAKEIRLLSKKGVQITEKMIRQIAIRHYRTPWIAAERAAFQILAKEGKCIYTSCKKIEYTEEFCRLSQKILNLIEEEESENSDGKIHEEEEIEEDDFCQFIRKYNIPAPKFSYNRIKAFLKRSSKSSSAVWMEPCL